MHKELKTTTKGKKTQKTIKEYGLKKEVSTERKTLQ